VNIDSCFSSDAGQKNAEIAWSQGDTALGRPKSRPRDVHEHSATAAGDPWPGIVVDFDDKVIKTIGPGQAVASFIGRALKKPIVAPVSWVLTPGIARFDAPRRQQRRWHHDPVRPPPQSDRMVRAARCPAVALAFSRPNTGPAERHRHGQGTREQPAPRALARPRNDANEAK
jgi:hypothetical protein